MPWTLGQEHFAELPTAHHNLLQTTIGFKRRQRTDHASCRTPRLSRKYKCGRIQTTIRKRLFLFAETIQWASSERLANRVTSETMAGGENPGPGLPKNNWAHRLADDIRVFQATERSTDSSLLPFGVQTV